jgi:hypothetical protein
VGSTPEDAPMNLSKKTGGILNELEKAHIYIEQLHRTIQEMQARLDALEETQNRPAAEVEGSDSPMLQP